MRILASYLLPTNVAILLRPDYFSAILGFELSSFFILFLIALIINLFFFFHGLFKFYKKNEKKIRSNLKNFLFHLFFKSNLPFLILVAFVLIWKLNTTGEGMYYAFLFVLSLWIGASFVVLENYEWIDIES